MSTIFVACPSDGDIISTTTAIQKICHDLARDGHSPMVPYVTVLGNKEDVRRAYELALEASHRAPEDDPAHIDEVHVHGDFSLTDFNWLLHLALQNGITVCAKSDEAQKALSQLPRKGN